MARVVMTLWIITDAKVTYKFVLKNFLMTKRDKFLLKKSGGRPSFIM